MNDRKISLTTLCYLKKDDKYLMLHRVVKKNDMNKDKWIGVGGHFESGESPDECLKREVMEETGYILTDYQVRGIVTFIYGNICEYMWLYEAEGFVGEPHECDEGVLEWVDIEKIWTLDLWEGDKIFFRLMDEKEPFFSLKLVYNENGSLAEAKLNDKELELFDVMNEDGSKTGIVTERGVAHRRGLLHQTVHNWVVRKQIKEDGNNGCGYDVLLQKRSASKDSNPGCYDISSAGHISAGDEPLESAVREIGEELGIKAAPSDFKYVGIHRGQFEAEFYGKLFRDNEISHVYVYDKPVGENSLALQESEVEAVMWIDYEKCREEIKSGFLKNCIYIDEFDMLGRYLGIMRE